MVDSGSAYSSLTLRRGLLALVPIGGLIASVALVLSMLDVRGVVESLGRADPRWVAGASALLALTVVLAALKVQVLLGALSLRVPVLRCGSAVLASATLNSFLPARGGDLVRGLFLADRREHLPLALAAVLVERLLDVFALGLLALAAGLASERPATAVLLGSVACLLAAGGAVVLLLGFQGIRRFADHGLTVRRALRRNPGRMLAGLALSAASWSSNVLILGACLRAVGVSLPIPALFANGPLAILAGVFPISVAGIGTRDAALVHLLRGEGAPEAIAAAGALYTVVQYGMLPLVGLVFLGREGLRKGLVAGAGPSPSVKAPPAG